jgi:DNA invertase Pin-like site-specific DNA recombinase
VIGLLAFRCLKRTEKNHLLHRGLQQGIADVHRHLTLVGDKISAFAHAVHQVVKRVDPFQQRGKRLRPVEVNVVTGNARQTEFLQAFGVACRSQHLVPLLA